MEKTTSLENKLWHRLRDVPHLSRLTLKKGEIFGWDYTACVISYNPHAKHWQAYLLHEASHALLEHRSYSRDIELLAMERAAWDKAAIIATSYDVIIDDDTIEDALDTYRNWLHSRSRCPACQAAGIQDSPQAYLCISCQHRWRVNDARSCALRRYSIKKRP